MAHVHECLYEDRRRYSDELIKMSADARSAVSIVLAGLVVKGETQVTKVFHIDRRYQDFVGKLNALGADIVVAAPPIS